MVDSGKGSLSCLQIAILSLGPDVAQTELLLFPVTYMTSFSPNHLQSPTSKTITLGAGLQCLNS